jgi:hypothetical protein
MGRGHPRRRFAPARTPRGEQGNGGMVDRGVESKDGRGGEWSEREARIINSPGWVRWCRRRRPGGRCERCWTRGPGGCGWWRKDAPGLARCQRRRGWVPPRRPTTNHASLAGVLGTVVCPVAWRYRAVFVTGSPKVDCSAVRHDAQLELGTEPGRIVHRVNQVHGRASASRHPPREGFWVDARRSLGHTSGAAARAGTRRAR